MTEAEINYQINMNRRKIASYESSIQKEEDRIFDLDALCNKVSSSRSNFSGIQASRHSALNRVRAAAQPPRALAAFVSGMESLISEKETGRIEGQFSEISRKAKAERQQCQDRISQLQRNIRACENTIYQLQLQLKALDGAT